MSGNNWWCMEKVFTNLGGKSKWQLQKLVLYYSGKRMICTKSNKFSDEYMQSIFRYFDIQKADYEKIYDKVKN